MSRLPNFFIAGAPKAGTTSLYRYLAQHPQIYMSAVKEPHYFAAEIREEHCDPSFRRQAGDGKPLRENPFGGIVTDWDEYVRLFAAATNELAVGEASVCYLWSPTAPARIAERIPDAKIILMLRDPADRAFSQYLHGVGNGVIRWNFRDHIGRNLGHRSQQFCIHYPFLELGFYSQQLGRYLEQFGRNVWLGFYEDWKARPATVFQEICGFLGVGQDFSPEMTRKHLAAEVPRMALIARLRRSRIWQTAANWTPASLRPLIRRGLMRKPAALMDPVDRRYLVEYYRNDICKLASLTGRNLDAWLR